MSSNVIQVMSWAKVAKKVYLNMSRFTSLTYTHMGAQKTCIYWNYVWMKVLIRGVLLDFGANQRKLN